MKKLVILILFNLLALHSPAQSGQGKVIGTVCCKANGERIYGAQLVLIKDGVRKASTLTEANGNYALGNVAPGNYILEVKFKGCQTIELIGVIVKANEACLENFFMTEPGKKPAEVVMR